MEKISRIGALLVQEGVIKQAQLDDVLNRQKEHPDLTVGEIVAQQFNIPEQYIETVFVEEILLKSLKQWFLDELAKKLKGLDVGKVVEDIQITINEFTRVSSAQKVYKRTTKGVFAPSCEKKYLSKIHCCTESITLKTRLGEDIVFQEFVIEYDVQSQKIACENESVIVEAKIKLMQLLKKKRG